VIDLYITNIIKKDKGFILGKGKEIKIKASGHAGFGSRNTDVVCAAASAVIQTAIVAVTRVAMARQKIKQKHGFLESVIPVKNLDTKQLEKIIIIISTMLAGLEELIKIYPQALRINFK
jgi:uncharacterized protein